MLIMLILMVTALVKGGKNLLQKLIWFVMYIVKGFVDLVLKACARTIAFFAIGAAVAITTTIIWIIIIII